MDYQKLTSSVYASFSGLKRILIVIKGSPDPDVLASSFALKVLCEESQIDATIVSLREVSLPQNKAVIQRLDIPVHFIKKVYSVDDYDAYAVLDHQSAWVDDIGTKIPCALHIDHHSQKEDKIDAKVRIISEEAGAVSTLMALILREKNIPDSPLVLRRLATALMFGIKTDTDDMAHSSDIDREAVAWLADRIDRDVMAEMESMPYSEETITVISKAVINEYFYKDWLFCGVGSMPEQYRDSIAITADYLLKNENVSGVVVFALISEQKSRRLYLDASIRTTLESLNINNFIRMLSSEGGGRNFKGAFQVNLDYFYEAPDKGKVWELVRATTIEKLKSGRDHITVLSIEGIFRRLKKSVTRVFTVERS